MAAYERAYSGSAFEKVQASMRKRLLISLLERTRPRSVLEVGCGLDTLARYWPHAERFVIVEPGRNFAAEARRAVQGRADVEVVESSLSDSLEVISAPFELILISGLLHEVAAPADILREARRLCEPSSLVHVNVPNARSFHRLLAYEMGLIGDVTQKSELQLALQQHHTFDIASLTSLVQSCGYEVVEEGSYFVKPFSHAQMEMLDSIGFLTMEMIDGLWGMSKHLPELGSEIFVNLRIAK